MPYNVLDAHLWPVADGVAAFLRREWGIAKLRKEEGAYREIKPIPTFSATMPDHHSLWVEVSNRAYPPGLDGVVADCMQHGFPVRLIVAVPQGLRGKVFQEDLGRAKQKGVGVIEVDGKHGKLLTNALSLSLASVQPIPRIEFPQKYRFHLSQAETTFKEGNPAKGCDDLYGIIENVTRKIAKVTYSTGLWNAGANPLRFDIDPWNNIVDALIRHLDQATARLFKDNILHRVIGVVPFRNTVVHIPKTEKDLQKRDRLLRTRF